MRSLRTLSLVPFALATLGCVVMDSPEFQRHGAVYATTNGVTLYDQGGGFAGMSGTTCQFSRGGHLGTDVSTSARQPKVLDGVKDNEGTLVLASTEGLLHVIAGNGSNLHETEVASFDRLSQAFLTRDHVVAIGGCTLRWMGGPISGQRNLNLESENCENAQLAVDRRTGAAFVTAGGEVIRVDEHGTHPLGHEADQIVFSQALNGLLLLDAWDTEVRFISRDGDLVWSKDLGNDGRIRSAADFGSQGLLGLTLESEEPSLIMLDGETGELAIETELSQSADVISSFHGEQLGLVLPSRVELFSFR
ncbi:MAG: hypothetical protein EA397_01190 [Deltaproteobacteria bacterium]|nr:MAG: hypothetical protein EA397_01190 [Deltaproteobacteria bacterium]